MHRVFLGTMEINVLNVSLSPPNFHATGCVGYNRATLVGRGAVSLI